MKVSLISYTQPAGILEDSEIKDIQDLVAYCARVSNPANQMNVETSENLIKYLIKHKHWSPLEMADATFEIETTRDIGRQILRHRSFSFQEFSQRYSDVAALGEMFELSEARLQDAKNRQNSIATDDKLLQLQWESFQNSVIDTAFEAYEWALQNGIAKEVARKVLPEGLTKTRMYMKGSIRSWIHFLEVRQDIATQKEHREVANAIAEALTKIFPMLVAIKQNA